MADHHTASTPPIQDQYPLRPSSVPPQPGIRLQYQPDYFDGISFMPSGPISTYNSPRHGQTMINEIGIQYQSGYGGSSLSPYQENVYGSPVQHHTYPSPGLYGRVPTPDNPEHTGRHIRAPRRLAPNAFSRTPSPPKRRKAAKKDSAKRSKLEKPLSELTAHLEHIPIKDTEMWVNRSLEQRQKEIGNGGFIKRPSNSFILYRSAYADRCREYEKSNNHQDISSMAGASWAIESSSIRKQYEDWAKVERENHQAAFPDYKFQPQTQEAKTKKRKEKFDDESLGESDPDDLTYMGRGLTPASARSTRTKKVRREFRDSSYTPSVGSDGDWGSPEPYPGGFNASYYQSANPGKAMPSGLTRLGPNGGYYHATSHPNARFARIGHVEDVMYQPNEMPVGSYSSSLPPGFAEATHEELLDENSLDNGHLTFSAPTLDPELLSFNNHGMPEHVETPVNFQAEDYLDQEYNGFGLDSAHVDGICQWELFGDGLKEGLGPQ